MKKAIKGLIVASAVAAVVGVGAVSFAAWTGNSTTATATGNTGSLETYGVSVQANNLTGNAVWVPYDQTQAIDNMVKVWEITLQYDGEETAGATYSLTINYAADCPAELQGKMYYSTSGTAVTDAPENLTAGWEAIGASAAPLTLDSNNKAYIVLDSNAVAQMNKEAKLEIKLVKAES